MRKLVVGIVGAVFVLVGILGFLLTSKANPLLLGLFPVDVYHNAIHLIIGLIGIATYFEKWLAPKPFCQIFGVVYIVLAIIGFILKDTLLFGMIHLGGADIWLHLVVGLLLGYFGFIHKEM